jgi:hypothetical protein
MEDLVMQIYQRSVAIEILAADGDVPVIFFNVPIYSTNSSLIGIWEAA